MSCASLSATRVPNRVPGLDFEPRQTVATRRRQLLQSSDLDLMDQIDLIEVNTGQPNHVIAIL
jgi:hypothetical protein